MKFITPVLLLITTSAHAAIFDSIESVDVIQKEVQAKNASKENRKPASEEAASETPKDESTNSSEKN